MARGRAWGPIALPPGTWPPAFLLFLFQTEAELISLLWCFLTVSDFLCPYAPVTLEGGPETHVCRAPLRNQMAWLSPFRMRSHKGRARVKATCAVQQPTWKGPWLTHRCI